MKARYLIIVAIALFAFAPLDAQTRKPLPDYNLLVTLEIAQAEAPGGQAILARRENFETFGFYFLTPDGRVTEVEVRKPNTIIKEKEIEEIPDKGPVNAKLVNLLRARPRTKLPFARYVEIALEQSNGTDINSVTLVPSGDRILIEVGVVGGQTVTMDENGKIVTR